MYYQTESVLRARQYIIIYSTVTFGDVLASMMDIENEPNPRAGVIHPAQMENNGSMVLGDRWVVFSTLNNGGNEDGEGNCQHAD